MLMYHLDLFHTNLHMLIRDSNKAWTQTQMRFKKVALYVR